MATQARKSATKKTVKKAAKKATGKAVKKTAAKAPARKVAKVAKPAAKKAATKKASTKKAASKAAAKKVVARKPVAKKTAARPTMKRAAAPVKRAAKKTPRPARRLRGITPEQALANTRALLEAKQAHDREPPPWQSLETPGGQAPHSGFESDEARIKADELHAGESRMQAIQGSVSTQDRHQQGKRDAR
jgi:hypothetical protein